MIVVPDEGKIELLEKTLRSELSTPESYSLRLFRNDYTPVAGSTFGSFTDATFLGYFWQDLFRSGWAVPTIEGGRAVTVYAERSIEWTCASGEQTVYGYWVVAPLTARVAWAERFTDPVELSTGKKLIIVPRLTGRGEL